MVNFARDWVDPTFHFSPGKVISRIVFETAFRGYKTVQLSESRGFNLMIVHFYIHRNWI